MLKKINIICRIITVVLLILLATLSIVYDFGDCNVCEFEYEGKTLDTNEFMDTYSKECFPRTTATTPGGNIDLSNINFSNN